MPPQPIHIEFRRSGGFAGISLLATATADQLPGDHEARLRGLLTSGQVPQEPGAPSGADQFHYQLSLDDGQRRRSFAWDETQVPAEIRPVLHSLTRLARPG